MSPTYDFKIITPQGTRYHGAVVHALVPAETGFVGILAHHAAYVTYSAGGALEVREKEGSVKKFKVGRGFFEVAHNQAVLLTQSVSE